MQIRSSSTLKIGNWIALDRLSAMEDSDDEYIDYISPDDPLYGEDEGISKRTRNNPRVSARGKGKGAAGHDTNGAGGYSWVNEYQRSWDVVQEDVDGSLAGVVAGIVEDNKKKRVLADVKPVQRGIIRNLILVLDLSIFMLEKDLRPNRYQMMLNYAIDFVTEFFDQNPISQLSIVGMKDGLATLISALDSSPHEHISALTALKKQQPKGDPSLQNALEACKSLLFHVPTHCTKEVVIIFGALLSSDPGDIHKTIDSIVSERIRIRVIGLAAQVAICKEMAVKSNYGDQSAYGVILNETHFKELLLAAANPPAMSNMVSSKSSTLVEMGFPSRVSEVKSTIGASDSTLTQGGYICPRCKSKVSTLPSICPCCNLTLILSTHLARSYHHLFPLKAFREVLANDTARITVERCFGCQILLPTPNDTSTHRFLCPQCRNVFCIDCDVFCHKTLHTCPGCQQTRTGAQVSQESHSSRKNGTTVKIKLGA